MRVLEAFGHKTNSFVLEMRRPIGHEAAWYVVGSTTIVDSACGVLRVCIWNAEKPFVVRIVVAQHSNVLITAVAWSNLYPVKLHEVIGLSTVDSRTKWAWYLLPFKGRYTVNTSMQKGLDVVRHGLPVELGPKGAFRDVSGAMN